MKHPLFLFACLLWLALDSAQAQTKLRLANIVPGTENVQLVYNGDLQFLGPVTTTNTHPFPTGWARMADMYADAGTNLAQVNGGVVARALVSGGASVCQYYRAVSLAPNSDYVLSAYLFGTWATPPIASPR